MNAEMFLIYPSIIHPSNMLMLLSVGCCIEFYRLISFQAKYILQYITILWLLQPSSYTLRFVSNFTVLIFSQKQAHVRGSFPVDRILYAFSLIFFSSLYFLSSAIDLAPPATLLILVISWLYSSSAFALFLSNSVCNLRNSVLRFFSPINLISHDYFLK